MAITYDLELNEVGVGVTTYAGLTSSDYNLTGLTATTDYQVRVRAIDTTNGVEIHSLWSAWTDFTTTVQQTDVIAPIGTITRGQTVHAITTVVAQPVTITYDLELTETGQSPTVTTGIATNSYNLTGLTVDTEYSVRVRQVQTTGTAEHPSLWSAAATFTAGQAIPDPVVSPIGTITRGQTVHSVTIDIGGVPEPVVSPIGTITRGQTVHAITVDIDQPAGVGVPTHWVVDLIDLDDMSTVSSDVVTVSNYSVTGLSANLIGGNQYRVSVTGISDLGSKSTTVSTDFSTALTPITSSVTPTIGALQAIDQFYVTANALYDELEDFVVVFGEVSETFNTLTGTLDSTPLTLNLNDLQYTSTEVATDPSGATQPAPTYPADVEISGTDWTGASTAVSTDSATLTFSDVSTTNYRQNNSGKPSWWYSSGTLALSHNHVWNNGEIIIPDNGKLADVAARIRSKFDFTLTLIKNGDYGNPITTATSSTIEDNGTKYQCDLSATSIVCVGGDRFEVSINPIGVSSTEVAYDPTLSFFTLTVTEVYV